MTVSVLFLLVVDFAVRGRCAGAIPRESGMTICTQAMISSSVNMPTGADLCDCVVLLQAERKLASTAHHPGRQFGKKPEESWQPISGEPNPPSHTDS